MKRIAMPVIIFRTTIVALALCWGFSAAGASGMPGETSLSGNYLAGRTASKLRDNDVASEYLSRALEGDSGNPVLIERVFLLELSEGNIEAAEELAVRVLGSNSQQRMARIVLGLRDFRVRHYEDARRNFTVASYTPVGELTSTLLSAWSHAGEGELVRALRSLDKLDGNESFANFKSFHAALISDYLGNAIRAEAFYKKAHEQAGTSLRVVQAYGNFLERNGRAEEATKIYTAFLDGGDDNPLVASALAGIKAGHKAQAMIATPGAGAAEALFSLATAMTDEQSIDVGLLYAQLALSFNADRPVAFTLLGDIYEDVKRPEKAIDAYSQVPETSALRANAEMEIAINLQRLERKDEALARLNGLLAQDPGDYDVLVTLGNIHRNNEDFAKAAEAYDRAIATFTQPQPAHWRVFYYSGISNERMKNWDKAEKEFRRALELAPEEAMVLNYLGYSMVDRKINLVEAMAMIKKAVALKPNDGYIVDSLGWAYFQLGDYEQALIHCERAVELLAADPIIGEHLGDVYWRVGRKLEAQFQWQHAKDNKPEPEDLKRIQDKQANGLPDEVPLTPVQNTTDQNNG
ncbi:MAG: tetratricopeptide repeat protein [Rhizobiales bacterium]|nr:tetratricopeptide repeat protein [Hyphomicrobiales bacterium]